MNKVAVIWRVVTWSGGERVSVTLAPDQERAEQVAGWLVEEWDLYQAGRVNRDERPEVELLVADEAGQEMVPMPCLMPDGTWVAPELASYHGAFLPRVVFASRFYRPGRVTLIHSEWVERYRAMAHGAACRQADALAIRNT